MARSKVLLDALRKYGIEPCGDNSCIFGSPGGMATNGGCRCVERGHSKTEARAMINRLAAALRDVVALYEDDDS